MDIVPREMLSGVTMTMMDIWIFYSVILDPQQLFIEISRVAVSRFIMTDRLSLLVFRK